MRSESTRFFGQPRLMKAKVPFGVVPFFMKLLFFPPDRGTEGSGVGRCIRATGRLRHPVRMTLPDHRSPGSMVANRTREENLLLQGAGPGCRPDQRTAPKPIGQK